MAYFNESLTNDQKIILLDMATRRVSTTEDFEVIYKKMVALVTTHNPEPEGKGTLTINIQGDIMNSESFIDAFVKRLNEEMKNEK